MKRARLALSSLLLLLILSSCGSPFDLTDKLGGKTLTYYSGISGFNGQDYSTLAFNKAGNGGNYELAGFSYGYADADAEGTDLISNKTWYQTYGERGIFSYDKKTALAVITIAETYNLKAAATTTYAADFEWKDILKTLQEDGYGLGGLLSTIPPKGDTCTLVSALTQTTVLVLNQDNLTTPYFSDGAGWRSDISISASYTDNGVPTTTRIAISDAYSISETALTGNMTIGIEETPVTTTSKFTLIISDSYAVDDFFAIGSTKENEEFADVWKAGRSVSFNCLNTRSETISYYGDEAPTEPSVDPSTGIGVSGTGVFSPPYYYLDLSGGSAAQFSFMRTKHYIIPTGALVDAARRIE